MDWRALCGEKLVTPEQALEIIQPTDQVFIAGLQSTPFTLCRALIEKRAALRGLRLNTLVSFFPWDIPGLDEYFHFESWYLSRRERPLIREGRIDYVPVSYFRANVLPYGIDKLDVYLVTVSAPDRHGFCSFGTSVSMSPLMIKQASRVIAEVDESFIRTGGENHVHLSALDRLVERQGSAPALAAPEVFSPEKQDAVDTICMQITNELLQDGDTIQIGAGDMTSPLPNYLVGKHELGMQTEIIPPGVVALVQAGILNGAHKTVHPGKVVGTAFHPALSPEELDFIDDNPAFELYDFNYTDDIRLLCQDPRFTAINNALTIDLTGQVASESLGPQMFTGTGGQTAFAIAACLAGGKSIIALPASSIVNAERLSRIVPTLAPGTVVTTPRAFVDYVVTEHGIATLRGKSLRQRAQELIAIAHPDFRADLWREARRLYHV
jgi:4-hydroxybutyrate CoA-transferase